MIDSYCRVAKTVSHWPWNLQVGVFFLGSKAEYFLQANDNIRGYQARDFNQTEMLRIKYPRLIDKNYFSLSRVKQDKNSTYTLPFDTFISKMGWVYDTFSDLKELHNSTGGFYVYQQTSLTNTTTDTYNMIDFLNPSSNLEKYKNYFIIVASFTYKDKLHVCLAYNVAKYEINLNYEKVDILKSQ